MARRQGIDDWAREQEKRLKKVGSFVQGVNSSRKSTGSGAYGGLKAENRAGRGRPQTGAHGAADQRRRAAAAARKKRK